MPIAVVAIALLVGVPPAPAAAPVGSGKTVAYGLSRSGSAGGAGGGCGTRLQCLKAAIDEVNAATTDLVENVALVTINVAEPDQDVNLKLSGKQLLIAPDADPSLNGRPDLADALNKVSLGGGTCFTCALQAAERSFAGARPDSQKVIVLVSERVNTYRSTGFTSSGLPTGYEPMELAQMAGRFDGNTVVRAFAVGPDVTCSADPNGYGSLADAAAVTPGGTCIHVAGFDGLGPSLTEAVAGGTPGPDITPPAVTLTTPAPGSFTQETAPTLGGAAGTASGDEPTVTVRLWEGSDTSVAPLQTHVALASAGLYSIPASPALSPGSYIVQAEQRDAEGNVGRSRPISFTVVPPNPGGVSYADAVRADAPRAYWRLGEPSGTVAAEDQGGPNGTYSGGAVLGVPPAIQDVDRAVRLDGGNDKMSVPDPANGSLDFGTGDFTVEAWIKPSASDERGVVAKRSGNAEAYWAITVTDDPNHNGQIRAVYFDGANVRTAYSAKGVVDGAWHHVVAWYDRDSGITIWVDGVARFTALGMTPDVGNSGPVEVGKAPSNPYFKGDVDEVALYGGLLPVHRIQAHADAAVGE
jgi:Concanavalin A-like lectin/glucanases superfamily